MICGAEAGRHALADGLRPDPLIPVSEWADQNRMLSSRESAEPGPWRTSRTPYLKEPMDSLSRLDPVQEGGDCGGCADRQDRERAVLDWRDD
jgi:phage terminase large subunit GpA-like protein